MAASAKGSTLACDANLSRCSLRASYFRNGSPGSLIFSLRLAPVGLDHFLLSPAHVLFFDHRQRTPSATTRRCNRRALNLRDA